MGRLLKCAFPTQGANRWQCAAWPLESGSARCVRADAWLDPRVPVCSIAVMTVMDWYLLNCLNSLKEFKEKSTTTKKQVLVQIMMPAEGFFWGCSRCSWPLQSY